VLLVEDEPGIVEFIEIGLRQEGVEVVSASTAAAAMRAIGELQADVAILDVGLPDGDGFDLLRRIRAGNRRYR
jgi:DNA-binding response OmpR family regulator